MSLNQSRAEKTEGQLRKTGRSGNSYQQRNFAGGGGKGGGGTAPPPSSSISSSRSVKRSSNGQGSQSRADTASANSESVPNARNVQNGSHLQSSLRGVSDAPVSGTTRPIDSSAPGGSRALPRAPSSQSAAGASDSTAPVTPSKGDACRAFPLQFGSISPGFMDGMQIPARTSSAPPNLDEQKRDQARHDSLRSMPTVPIPSASKQQQQHKKDASTSNQSNVLDSHAPTQAKRDAHVQTPSAPVAVSTQKSSVLPIPGMSVPMPFQQQQVPVQFGGPNPSQAVASSLQMPMALPVPNTAQVPQHVFVTGLHSHPLQPQGMVHQGFATQMGHQLAPQLSNLGIGMAQQYAQQQAGKFGGSRKAVKITHPDTHEELRLDKKTDSYPDVSSSGPRTHANVVSQSQPIQSFPPSHQINYYPTMQSNSYNPTSVYFPPTSVPLTSNQITLPSSTSRYNYPVGQGGPTTSLMNPPLNNVPASKSGNLEHAHDVHVVSVSPPLSSVQVTVKPPVGSLAEKIGTSSVTVSSPASKVESPKLLKQSGDVSLSNQQKGSEICSLTGVQLPTSLSEPLETTSLPVLAKHPSTTLPPASLCGPSTTTSDSPTAVEESATVAANSEGRKRDPIRKSESIKDQQKKTTRKEPRQSQQQHQADASDSAGDLKMSLPKIPIDSSSSDLYSVQVVKATENLQSPSVAVGPASTVGLPSPTLECRLSSCGRVSETEEGKHVAATSQISVVGVGAAVESSSDVHGGSSVALETKPGGVQVGEGSPCEPSNPSGLEADSVQNDCIIQDAGLRQQTIETAESQRTEAPQDCSTPNVLLGSAISESSGGGKQTEPATEREAALDNLKETVIVDRLCNREAEEISTSEDAAGPSSQVDRAEGNLDLSATASSDSVAAETNPSNHISWAITHEEKSSTSDVSKVDAGKNTLSQEVVASESGLPQSDMTSLPTSFSSELALKLEGKLTESANSSLTATLSSGTNKMSVDQNRLKSTGKKKKKKELLLKADAAGTTFDLYNAYKGPVEKLETTISSDSVESSSAADVKQLSADDTEKDVIATEEDAQSKAELEDWEDAADVSTPKLKTSENGERVRGYRKHLDEDGSGIMSKQRYTRDFLLTLAEQCSDLPVNFEIGSDIADALMSVQVSISHLVEPYSSHGRIIDRPAGGSRLDRRGSGIVDDDKWSKAPNAFTSGRDPRLDAGHGGVGNFRPAQGGNHGVLRNPRGQSSGQYVGGILSGPMQSMGSSGGMARNSPDADRWQRATGLQKGLIPSPQTPLQVMHKAERKYEVGKVSDEQEAKQRQLKAILNKLTPQNFEKLFVQVKMVNIDSADTLRGIISQIFDKALMEPTFCEMYANFCYHLAGDLPDFIEDNEKITFKRLLLNKCQEEFERGEREQAEANRDEEEGEIKRSVEEREEKKVQARRRMLGNIRLIGELYKKRMLTERIMHECIKTLLGQPQSPDEEDVEALCKLMSTIGEMIDHPKAKEHIDAYFDMMTALSNNQKLSSRVRFMLKDVIDLRKNKWQQRRKIEGPKKIEEVHRDAAQERQAQTSRLSRGPSLSSSSRRGQPVDYGPRGSSLLSSPGSQQMGGLRGVPAHVRGFATQDVRLEDRHSFEGRTLSAPLQQRPADDDSITLGPQGGLGRGMSIRGQPLMPNAPLPDVSGTGDLRRMPSGPNGYNSISDWTHYNSRDELMPRYEPGPDRVMAAAAYEQSNYQERNSSFGNRDLRNADHSSDRPSVTSTAVGRLQGSSAELQSVPSEPIISEDKLRDMSIAAIREFYSARNEDEVRLCIKDLNSPSFYPDMIMLWVTDSFDRKDVDRDLLAKLLVNLSRPRDSLLSYLQLIQGFQSVLSTLEDAVTDSPKAADYLGRIFAKVILENVIPFREIGRLIHEGGDEPGSLLQSGLASDVLVSILEIIRQERGDSGINEIRMSSNLRLEDFRPSDPIKLRKLDAFIY